MVGAAGGDEKFSYICRMEQLHDTIERIVIVGSGNVAEAFARAAKVRGIAVAQIFARNPERGRKVARMAGAEWCNDPARLAAADLYIIAVSDDAVAAVAQSLPFAEGAIVAHTAGCGRLDAIPERWRRAVIYPFQTFTAGREVDFSQIPIFIEGSDSPTTEALESFARRLSRRVARADSTTRRKIHLAGVFACNFANRMFGIGCDIVREAGFGFDILRPLIAETAAKAVASQSPAEMQTGPAVRGDRNSQERHLGLLADEAQLCEIYKLISDNIWQTSKKR